MDTAIITGLISAGAAIAVCLINNHYIQAESDKKHEANIMLVSYRIEQLEKKGDKVTHNGLRWISEADSNVWEPGVYGWTNIN